MKMKSVLLLSFITILAVIGCGSPQQESRSALDLGGGIVGGEAVQTGSRVGRSVVAIFAPHFGLCSGTIISPNAILTAAHCVPTDPGVRVNIIFDTRIRAATAVNSRPVMKMYTSPRWRMPKSLKNWGDLAIMKFAGGLPPGYGPVPLLPFPQLIASHTPILLSGFGVNDGIGQTGAGVLRDTLTMITNANYSETEVMVDQRDGRGSCNGDSGGPAFIQHSGAIYLWGVVSRGDNDCLKDGIYTNALVYKKWIKETLQEL